MNDKILIFGTADATNHKSLQAIGAIVKNNIDVSKKQKYYQMQISEIIL